MDEEEELPMVSIPQHSIEPKEEEDKKEIKENLLESKEPEEPSSNPNPKQCDFVPELTVSQLIADSSTNEPEIVGEEKVDANEANMVVEEEGIAPSMDGNEEEVVGEEIFSSRVEKDFGELEDVGEEVSEGVGEEAPLTISDYPEFAAEEGLGEFGGQGSSIGAEEREVFAEASMVAEIVAPLTDAEEMEYVAEEVSSLVANEDEKSPSKEDEIAEKAPSLGAADTEVAAEKASSMGAECDFVAEEAPSMVADEAEEPPSMEADVVEEAPSIVTNESEFVAVEIPLMAEGVAEELPSLTEDKREVVTEGTPLVVAEEPSSLVAEEDRLMIREEEPSSVVGTNHLMVQEEPSSIVAKEDHSMVQEEEASSIVAKEHLTVQEEEPSSVVATEDHLIVQEEEPTSVVAKDDHSMVQVEEPSSVVAKEDQSTVQEEKPSSVVATENHPMIQEEEPSSVGAKEDHMMVQEEEPSSLVAKEDHLMVREEEPSSLVAEEDHVMDEEEEEVGPEVAIEAELETEEEVAADAEMETDDYEVTEIRKSGGKRKRGRPAKAQPKPLAISKTVEEDVCFICFDGGEIVLCDRRGCPKAYHPACINRDEAFFRSKGRWTCGWHICSNCQKAAYHMCYTCTFSLCKGCIKDAEFFCIRGDKGFCETCRSTIMLIEKMEQGNNEMPHVDFEDKGSWEYLFKDYWLDLKGRLSLTSDELLRARNPWKGSNELYRKEGSSDELYSANDDQSSDSDSSSGHPELRSSKKRRARGRPKSSKEEVSSVVAPKVGGEGTSTSNDAEWASEDLLEFVAHMKNGDKSFISQYDVQHLLLEYIKLNNLRDPRKKSQIVCDSRLTNLFGKPRVGHFEMLKLLENHFLVKEDAQADDTQAGNVTAEENQIEADGSGGGLKKDRRRKTRRKGDEREPQTNLDDYAAIDVHNIRLVYLRRNLLEDLLEDSDKFHDMVVGSFVRIRISGSGLKQDMYRLVQVLGTQKASQPYKTGKRSTDVVLEILNLNKTEVISIDTISNQEFSEDECKRLRQSIKCGLISRMTVGEVQEKAMTLQAVRANDLLETEKMRITHLRDRASEQGRRKELRECVEKLQLLNRPEERSRRLQEIPEVHADPNMDPNYESEEDEEPEDKQQDNYTRPRDSGFSRKGREPISPGKVSSGAVDTWNGTRKNSANASESGRNMSMRGAWGKGDGGDDRTNDFSWNQGNDAQQSNSWEKPKTQALTTGSDPGAWSGLVGRSGPSSAVPSEAALQDREVSPSFSETDKIWNYKDPSGKIQGPFSMVQLRKWSTTGYFPPQLRIWRTEEKQEDSILLNDALKGKFKKEPPPIGNSSAWNQSDRKWNSNGSQTANGNVKAANGDGWGSGSSGWSAQSQVHGPRPSSFSGQPNQNSWNTNRPTGFQPNTGKGWSAPSVETPKFAEGWGVDQSGKNTSSNLPSPTPKTGGAGWPSQAAQDGRRDFVDPPTPTPRPNNTGDWTGSQVGVPSGTVPPNTVNPHVSAWVAPGNISVERLPSPTPTSMPQAGSHSTAAFAVPNPVPSGNYAGPPNMMSNQNIQPPVPVNANWGMTPNQNPNPAWGPLPPPPPPPDNQVAGWSAPPPNTNVGWGGPEQGHAATGWGAVPQANPAAIQGTVPQGNPNMGWGPPAGNTGGRWDNHQRNDGHRDWSSRGGGDSGHSSGRSSWNRQSSFGGGSGRGGSYGPRRSGICRYHLSGHCKKGAGCDHPHS